jgi:hypothetical protein
MWHLRHLAAHSVIMPHDHRDSARLQVHFLFPKPRATNTL